MQICIAGWYFNEDLLKLMVQVNEQHPVTIVAHQEGDSQGLPCHVIKNVGLEFHMYNHFLMNFWDGKSKVLFMHDDISVAPVMVNNEVIPAINIFNKIAEIDKDQGYVFENEADEEWNNEKHGRMILMSRRLLQYLKECGGIYYDPYNPGYTMIGPYNNGIDGFHERMMDLNKHYSTCFTIYAPVFKLWRRNGRVSHASSR